MHCESDQSTAADDTQLHGNGKGFSFGKMGISNFSTSLSTLVMCNDSVESKDVLIASGIHPLISSSSAISVSLHMQIERTLIHKTEKQSHICLAHIST